MAHQLVPYSTGAYDHEVVKTRYLDALTVRGMRFDAAYCNSPLCAQANVSEFAASIPTFAHYFKSLGYSTCLSRKMRFVA